jgi:hypothetical protein
LFVFGLQANGTCYSIILAYGKSGGKQKDRLFEAGFRLGYSCESQVIMVARTLQTHWITEVG